MTAGEPTIESIPSRRRPRGLGRYLLLPIPLGWMTVFYLIPIGILLLYAFWSIQYPEIDHTLTLKNFRTFFSTDLYARVLFRTIWIALAVTITDIVIAFPLAFFLAKRVTRHREILLMLVIFPLWSSYLVRIFAWKSLLGTTGILNSFLSWTGIVDQPVSFFLYSKWSMYIAFSHVWLPFMILPLVTILERIPNNLMEAAADLGGNWARTFVRVILPLARPGILAGSLSVFSLTMGDYITPTLLGGPGDQMIGKLIADQFGLADNQPLGAMLVIPVLLTISLVLAIANRAGAMERTAA